MLDVKRLRLLREVQVRGTLAAVGAALHLSPSAVSQQLRLLEREVGHPLLQRAGRGLQLTPQGELLVEHTSAILDRLELAESELLASLAEATGTVRVAIFQSAALALLVPMLRLLAARHPRVRVTLTQREPGTALLETFARDFDLVVAEQYPGHAAPWHDGLDRVVLTHDAIRLTVPRTWRHVTALGDTAELPWVVEQRGAASRHFAEQACRQAGFEPDIRFETDDLQAHAALIRSGNACALVPDLLCRAGARRAGCSISPQHRSGRCSPPPAAPAPTARPWWPSGVRWPPRSANSPPARGTTRGSAIARRVGAVRTESGGARAP